MIFLEILNIMLSLFSLTLKKLQWHTVPLFKDLFQGFKIISLFNVMILEKIRVLCNYFKFIKNRCFGMFGSIKHQNMFGVGPVGPL